MGKSCQYDSIKMMLRLLGVLCCCQLLLGACQQDLPTPYALEKPPGFQEMVIPEGNATTLEGVTLGRHLFFDPILSLDSTISCSHCHKPGLAFTDALSKSLGTRMRKGIRSSPSLLNIGFHHKGLFWDGRAAILEEQALHPITDSLEMSASWDNILPDLKNHTTYPTLFKEAFGTKEVTPQLIGYALAQYQRTLISANSKYDSVQVGLDTFTISEQRGWSIFFDAGYPELPMGECAHCHEAPLFTTLAYENNGIEPKGAQEIDEGRSKISGNKYDRSKFKVPTLRNISITAPYMHDGRFRTLEEVIDHYNSGGHYALNVSPNVRKLHLSDRDKNDLIQFLHTLTDHAAIQSFSADHVK